MFGNFFDTKVGKYDDVTAIRVWKSDDVTSDLLGFSFHLSEIIHKFAAETKRKRL